ncbi:MAG: D-alanine--D-alanine ligase [Phycisphaerae bacterium]|nr:D-alanine--D-alanine ligase [Phycisphaerae bacterium]
MKIGLTYDLRDAYLAAGYSEEETAEFDRGETIDELQSALESLGHDVDRIGHVRELAARLVSGDRWELVFNIAEGLRGFGREAQIPGLLDAFEIPYTFSDPLTSSLTLHKGLTKRVLRDCGLPTAPFAEVSDEADVDHVDLPYPLFVKPIAEGTSKGIDGTSRVSNMDELRRVCRRIIRDLHQPALVESFLSGREFTVGVTGTGRQTRAVGTLEVELLAGAEDHACTYVNKERCEELCRYALAPRSIAEDAESIAIAAWRALGCRDGGRVDLRADAAGSLHLLEVNPLPGLHPTHSDLPMLCTAVGMPYHELIDRIVRSAMQRIPSDGRAVRAAAVAAPA